MMDRRSFLRNTGRWSILALLAGLVWFLFRNRELGSGSSCSVNEFCRNCSQFGSCDLPQAIQQS